MNFVNIPTYPIDLHNKSTGVYVESTFSTVQITFSSPVNKSNKFWSSGKLFIDFFRLENKHLNLRTPCQVILVFKEKINILFARLTFGN